LIANTAVSCPAPNGIHPLAHSPTLSRSASGYVVGSGIGKWIGSLVVTVPSLVESVYASRLSYSPLLGVPGGSARTQVSTRIAYTSPPAIVPLAVTSR
jgi:hypothetical protein